jgi:hypothetical protein
MKCLLFFVLLMSGASFAHAARPVIDANVFYFTDGFTYGTSPANAYKRILYDLSLNLPFTKKNRLLLGWNYASYTFSDNTGTETSLKVTDMGPKLTYYFNKDRTWVAGFTYNLITKADYTPGGGTVTELRGTSMKFEAGYMPQMWENVLMGAKINYYKADFKEEITNQTALAQVTHNRTVIYPSFAVTFRWD